MSQSFLSQPAASIDLEAANSPSAPVERAPYATFWEETRGRLHEENPASDRTPFQRDRDRLVHCAAFRRLMHKTQVFISPEQDHVRTRLTHSIEVSQIARSIGRVLRLDEDLTEFMALGHDIGHPPFGHTGEDALDEVMKPYGGYDHNDQALRVVTKLERKYPNFDGLNLSWETLEGLVKHNGPLIGEGPKAVREEKDLPRTIKAYNEQHCLDLHLYSGLEAQSAAISDDIAYNHHDMDDGLRSRLFTIGEVSEQAPHVGAVFEAVAQDYPHLDRGSEDPHRRSVLIAEVVRRLIGDMIADVLAETQKRLDALAPRSVEDIRNADHTIVAFSPEMAEKERSLKAFLFKRMYRNDLVNSERQKGRQIIHALFRHYMQSPGELPKIWQAQANVKDRASLAVVVSDYIAGMTDRYATREAALLTGTRFD